MPEEFYDLQNDPDARHNLIGEPKSQREIRRFRADLLAWMQRTKGPLAARFAARIEIAEHSGSPIPSSP